MDDEGLYADRYVEFLARRAKAAGYDFGQGPPGNIPPPTVIFAKPLRWWTLYRPRRLAAILAERDRLQNEILALAQGTPGRTEAVALRPPHRVARERNIDAFSEKERARHGCPEELRRAA
jgi:hypothetical protein